LPLRGAGFGVGSSLITCAALCSRGSRTARPRASELTEDGASEEAAVDLAEWLSEVEYGGNTPST
jgi:hypothetical protein